MAIPELVSIAQLKAHLRLPVDQTVEDELLQSKIDQATVLVLDYVNQRISDADAWSATVAAWTDETVPMQVQAAILTMAAYLYRFRGDDPDAPRLEPGYLPSSVTMYLFRLRDPALA